MAVTLLSDNFNRPNSTNLGPDWQEVLGNLQIFGNQLLKVDLVALIHLAKTTAADVADMEVSINTFPGGGGAYVGVVGRYKDTNNYYVADKHLLELRLRKRVGGAFTTLGTYATASSGGVVKLKIEGSTLNVFLDGTLRIGPITDTAITGTGNAGAHFDLPATDTSCELDDFLYDSLSPVELLVKRQLPLRWTAEVLVISSLPLLWLRELLATRSHPIGWLLEQLFSRRMPLSWTNILVARRRLPLQWQGAGVLFTFRLPLSWQQTLLATRHLPLVWVGPEPLLVVWTLPLQWREMREFARRFPIQWVKEEEGAPIPIAEETVWVLIGSADPEAWVPIVVLPADVWETE